MIRRMRTSRNDEFIIIITVEDLAEFMNSAWPSAEWAVLPHTPELWQSTFRWAGSDEIYRPMRPDDFIDLYAFDGRVVWTGDGEDPTEGRGLLLSELFLEWQTRRYDAALVAEACRPALQEIASRQPVCAA